MNDAIVAGFNPDSLMILLGDSQGENDFIGTTYKYYFYDEPYKHDKMSIAMTYGAWIAYHVPSAKYMISDYYWPEQSSCWPDPYSNGWKMKAYLSAYPNMYIYFDGGKTTTLCGNAHDYWDEYKSYYGMPVKNLTNQIFLAYKAENWGDLLNVAMAWSAYGGFNPIWVYADEGPENEGTVTGFCLNAWQTHWLLRYARHVVVTWICTSSNPCVNCAWPDVGNWHIASSYIDNYAWFEY